MDDKATAPSDPAPRRRSGVRWRRLLGIAALGLVALLVLAQLVPYGHSWVPFGHPTGNPPVTKAAVWSDPQAQRIAEGACYDCHSSLTDWWIGTEVAPMSWLAQHDVDEGRSKLDFSEWDTPQPDLEEVVEAVDEGEMPPLQYKAVHADARLSAEQRTRLVEGLTQLYAIDPPAATRGERHGDDD